MSTSCGWEGKGRYSSFRLCAKCRVCRWNCDIPWQCVLYLSALEMLHVQVLYKSLPLPLPPIKTQLILMTIFPGKQPTTRRHNMTKLWPTAFRYHSFMKQQRTYGTTYFECLDANALQRFVRIDADIGCILEHVEIRCQLPRRFWTLLTSVQNTR